MITRREFIKKTALMSAGLALADTFISPLAILAQSNHSPVTVDGGGTTCLLQCAHSLIQKNYEPYFKVSESITLAGLFIQNGNRIKGLEILHKTSNDLYGKEYLPAIAVELFKAGERERALLLLGEADRLSFEDSPLFPFPHSIPEAYFKLGLHDEGEYRAFRIPWTSEKADSLTNLAEGHAEIGNQNKAYDLLAAALSFGRDTFKAPIVYAKLGCWDEAFRLLEKPYFEASKDHLYLTIGRYAAESGNGGVAKRVISSVLKAVDYGDSLSHTFRELAWLNLLVGNYEQAGQMLSKALEYIGTVDKYDFWPPSYAEGLIESTALLIEMDRMTEATFLFHKALDYVAMEEDALYKSEAILYVAAAGVKNRILIGDEELALLKQIEASKAC